jgi:hypothetical protein
VYQPPLINYKFAARVGSVLKMMKNYFGEHCFFVSQPSREPAVLSQPESQQHSNRKFENRTENKQ